MWRFLHLTDSHLGQEDSEQWNNRTLHPFMPDIMRCLRSDLKLVTPDFLLATGDLASHHGRDAIFAARDFLDFLDVPYFPLGGNTDFGSETSRRYFIEAFSGHLPVADTVYSFNHKNLHFCVIDPWWRWSDGTLAPCMEDDSAHKWGEWAIPPYQLRWLDDDLGSHSEWPTVIAVHYPILPIPDRLQKFNQNLRGSLVNSELFMSLLRRHQQVKLLLTGHRHLHCILQSGYITQVTTGALIEYPIEYRDIHVYDDRIEIHTLGLSNDEFANRSLIEGNHWPAGEEQDRHAVIPIDLEQ